MQLSSYVAFSLLGIGHVLATTHMMGEAASATASADAAGETVHTVQVSNAAGDLVFAPDNIQAAIGDLVQFQFWPMNHSVVQATFDQPCTPIDNVVSNATNTFFSGFMPVAPNSSERLTYTIRVESTDPVWYYCSQSTHCQAGMVGAINAATTGAKTVAEFKNLAAQAAENLSPGQSPQASPASVAPPSASGSGAASLPPPGANATVSSGGSPPVAGTSSAAAPAQVTTNAASPISVESFKGLALGALVAVLL